MELFQTLTFAGIIAVATTVVGVVVKVIGFPDQIRKNYKRKSTKGLSTIFWILGLLSYTLWTIHGVIRHDPALIIGQGLGVITTGVIVCQIYIYRKNN